MNPDINFTELLSKFVNRWFLLLIPFTLWFIFKDIIKTGIYYVKLRWSNQPFSTIKGEVYVNGYWWDIKLIKFSYLILEREEALENSDRKYRVFKRININKFWEDSITYRVWR